MLDSAGAYIVVIDRQGRIVRTNDACEAITGIAPDLARGLDFRQLDLAPEELVRFDGGESNPELERSCRARDGTRRYVDWSSKYLYDSHGHVRLIICTGMDVTERRRLQQQLSGAQRLEAAGRVAGQIAHDFNNLLSPMTAYPRIISEHLSANHTLRPLLNEIEISANRIAEINQQLLALGRRGHYAMDSIDLHRLLQEAVSPFLGFDELELEMNLDAGSHVINGGKAQLSRALANLLNNAREAILGEGRITITTQNLELHTPISGYKEVIPGGYIKLDISDTGMGIDPDIVDRIYDPFFTTKTMDRLRGSGLGLSVVHGIVHDHKGYLSVSSNPGRGTTFSLYFPLSSRQIVRDADNNSAPVGGNESILVVDDDAAQRNVASMLLRRLGYKVHAVENGQQAVAHARKYATDLMLIDMLMDGMDGTETYAEVLKLWPTQKAIILSGYAMTERVQAALNLGASSFMTKPIIPDALAKAVRQVLDKN